MSNTATEIAAFFHVLIVDAGIAEIAGDTSEENHISFADGFSESVVLPDFDEIEAGLRSGTCADVGVIGSGIAPFVVLSSLQHLNIGLAVGIALFTTAASLLAMLLLRWTRETRGLALSTGEEMKR